ncbi:hypothetical protein OPIT5_11890 [Opitutaceae bacterium TAV5]|nr:hypothetical protein OPIT5_11890 [Opitutaceae bacterium TAV5]
MFTGVAGNARSGGRFFAVKKEHPQSCGGPPALEKLKAEKPKAEKQTFGNGRASTPPPVSFQLSAWIQKLKPLKGAKSR